MGQGLLDIVDIVDIIVDIFLNGQTVHKQRQRQQEREKNMEKYGKKLKKIERN